MYWSALKQKAGRRIVVTGMGSITPLGYTPQEVFDNLLAGKSALIKIPKERFPEIDQIPVKIGGLLLDFDLEKWYKMMPYAPTQQSSHGFAAAVKAMEDSGYQPSSEEEKDLFGVIGGTGTSSGREVFDMYDKFYRSGEDLSIVPSNYIENTDIHGMTASVSKYFKARGPSSTVTAACATGQSVIMEAYRNILLGEAKVMLAFSAENVVIPYGMRGFASLGAINTKGNDDPVGAARPMDESREGLVASDGGNAVVLEDLEHALKRGATIYGEVKGFSQNCDGYHLTRPTAEGQGIYRTMSKSLEMADVDPKDVQLVHAHAAGTKEGDKAEMKAIDRIFGNHMPYITGCKGNTGHMMCTVGTFHCIESLLSIQQSVIPPVKNLKNPIKVEGKLLKYVMEPTKAEVNNAIMNNVGFGGINSTLVVSKYVS